jgi:hypothetical protein
MPRTVSFRRQEVSSEVIQIVPYNEVRTTLLIRVESGGPCYVSNDSKDVQDKGYPLNTGEYISFLRRDGDIPEFELFGVAPTTPAVLKIIEGYGEV